MNAGARARLLLRRLGADVRPGEERLAAGLFGLCFLLGTFQFAAKALRQSTFVASAGADELPYVYLLIAALAFPVARLYAGWSTAVSLRALLVITNVALALGMVAFWWLLRDPGPPVAYGFYLWVSLATVLAMSQYWAFAGGQLDVRQARRLFSLFSAGGLLGAVLGGQLAGLAVRFGLRPLVLVATVPLLAAALGVQVFGARLPPAAGGREDEERKEPLPPRAQRMLRLLSGLLMLGVVVSQIVDLQFSWVVEQRGLPVAEQAAVFGDLFSVMGIVAFVFQLFVAPRIYRHFGVGVALHVLPAVMLIGALAVLLCSALWPAPLLLLLSGLKVGENGLRYSLDQAARELLFVPLPELARRRAKAYVDVVAQRVAKGVASLLLVLVPLGVLHPLSASWLAAGLAILWLVLAASARREYLELLRSGMTRSGASEPELEIEEAATLEALVESLGSAEPLRVLHGMALLDRHGRSRLVPPLLLLHDEPAVRLRTLEVLQHAQRRDALPLIQRLVGDREPEVRAAAVQTIALLSGQAEPELMRPRLRDADPRVRAAAIASLARHGTPEDGRQAAAALRGLLDDGSPQVRCEAAKALGAIDDPRFQEHVVTLLYDRAQEVVRVAIVAAGQRMERRGWNPLYVPSLVSLLGQRRLKHEARHALVQAGEAAVPALVHFLRDPQEDMWVRRGLPKTLGRIGTRSAAAALLSALDEKDALLRRKVIEAVASLRAGCLDDELRRHIGRYLERECRRFLDTMVTLVGLRRPGDFRIVEGRLLWLDRPQGADVPPSAGLLDRLLADRLEGHALSVLLLLSALTGHRGVQAVRRQLRPNDERARSRVLEYLDTLLSGPQRRLVLAVVDDQPLRDRLRFAERELALRPLGRTETLAALLDQTPEDDESAAWLVAASLYAVGQWRERPLYPRVALASHSRHPLVRETARWVMEEVA